jgi:translation initiation factor IF-1
MPSGDDKLRFDGIIEAALGNGFFRVSIPRDDSGQNIILCSLSGKMRTKNIKVVEGDSVEIDVDQYDMSKGRIVYRKR